MVERRAVSSFAQVPEVRTTPNGWRCQQPAVCHLHDRVTSTGQQLALFQ